MFLNFLDLRAHSACTYIRSEEIPELFVDVSICNDTRDRTFLTLFPNDLVALGHDANTYKGHSYGSSHDQNSEWFLFEMEDRAWK